MKFNGTHLVLIILFFGIVGAGLTVWNYSRHVFSTNNAFVTESHGHVRASFPPSVIEKLHSGQYAKVTLAHDREQSLRAQITTVEKECIILQLLEKPTAILQGEACEVTVDTTLPVESIF